jgi:hypothetical protein
MSFKYGTDVYLMGYLTMEHPSVSNPSVQAYVRDKWYNHMDTTIAQDTNDDKFLVHVQRLKDANLIVDEALTLPISVEKLSHKWNVPGENRLMSPCFKFTFLVASAMQPIT